MADTATCLRVVFVITALDVGGAQMMLLKLLSRIDRRHFEPHVIVLRGLTDMLPSFQAASVPCHVLGMHSPIASISKLIRLPRLIRDLKPDVVQGWMYHGNLAASAACAAARLRVPVLWNIRATLIDRADDKRLTEFLIWLGGKLSFVATRIVNNSAVSAAEHEQRFGYAASRTVILPNGFDTERFQPSPAARAALLHELGLTAEATLVGLTARYHGMKDHGTFMRAARAVAERYPDVHFVLAGEGVEHTNEALRDLIADCRLEGRVHLLGRRDDVEQITASLDIAVSSSSSGEGFPNVVGEAMSCGVPCVVTNVGDSASVVGDTGLVVPPRDAAALAAAVMELVRAGDAARKELGARARERVLRHYSLERVVRQYEELYDQVHRERVGPGMITSLRSSR